MSTQTSKVVISFAAAVLCLGAGLKVLRYMEPPQRMGASFDSRLVGFLHSQAWHRIPEDPGSKNSAVKIVTFMKANCTAPMRVSIVGMTSGLESYLRQSFGDNIAFVQHGTVLDHPSLLRFQIFKTWTAIAATFTRQGREQRPILAVIPAPKQQPNPCDGPSIAHWESL